MDPLFDPNQLQVAFQDGPAAPISNAGLNQTFPVGTNVTVNALGTPPSVGFTYSYMFVSRPPGSNTRLFFGDTPTPFSWQMHPAPTYCS